MGHKIHIDQNEKLVMFGVTHILAVDGYSSKVVAHTTMPVKNNLRIYEEVYRLVLLNFFLASKPPFSDFRIQAGVIFCENVHGKVSLYTYILFFPLYYFVCNIKTNFSHNFTFL